MKNNIIDLSFFKKKRILITGNTGFKGSWLCKILEMSGAYIAGYALKPPTIPSLFNELMYDKTFVSFCSSSDTGECLEKKILNIESNYFNGYMQTIIGDITNNILLGQVFDVLKPEIVIHMAAQPLVRESYINPVYTYDTNVMGTVNLLECCRNCDSVKSIVNVTTDKVYRNNEWNRGYIETDYLDGYDPYSNSKSCSELVTHSYIKSFFSEKGIPVSTCRAGNVIGGGDFAKDRIIPDCFRAAQGNENIIVRNPYSIRPYQHVLEPLFAYLIVAMEQYNDPNIAGAYNVGPDDESCVTTGDLVDLFVNEWNKGLDLENLEKNNLPVKWVNKSDGGPHEAKFLKLDCTKLKNTFNWSPVWNIEEAINKTVEWYKAFIDNEDINECMTHQIKEYMRCLNK